MSLAEVNDSCNGGESSCTNLGGLIETVINGDRLDVDKIATEEEESLKFEDVNYGVTPVVGFEKLSEEEDGSSMGTSNSSHPPSDECQPDSRSDGSDSGLGSDGTEDRLTSAKNDSFSSDELPARNDSSSLSARSSLPPNSTPWQYCDEPTKHQHETQVKLRSTLKRPHGPDEDVTSSSSASSTGSCSPKRAKKSIAFGEVDVYYFPRVQGFTCVPSQGGSTLGMILTHTDHHTFTIAEHVSELRRNHREILARLRDSSSSSSTSSGGAGFNGSSANSVASSSSSDSDTDDQNTESELDPDNYFFLQPVPTRQRRALLRAAGVRKIDTDEKDECRDIRSSREFCGCSCKGYCDPDTCDCSQAGIKCQVDRLNFPCGCTHDGCANSSGRIEFNPMRVRTHFIHTMMRLEMEKKREQEEDETNRLGPSTHQHRHVPPQSITSSSQDSAASTSASFQNYCDVYYNQIYGPSSTDDPPGDPGGPNHSVPPSTSSYSQSPSASYPPYSQVDYGPVNYTPVLHHDSSQFAPFPTNVSPPRNYHIHPSHHESFSDLLQARYSDAVLDSLVASSVTDQKLSLCHDDLIVPSETEVEPENFGEIIKKTMVESASA